MERTIPRASRDFGPIEQGHERHYMYMTDTIESNLLKVYRKNPSWDANDAWVAILMCLLAIDGQYSQGEL